MQKLHGRTMDDMQCPPYIMIRYVEFFCTPAAVNDSKSPASRAILPSSS